MKCEAKQNTNTTNTSLSDKTNLVHEQPSSHSALRSSLMSINLPPHWQVSSHLDEVQYTKFQPNENGVMEVRSTVVVHSDLTWSVHLKQKPVPVTCQVLPQASTSPSPSMVLQLLDRIDCAYVCPGNPDSDFVHICQKRGGVMKGERGNGETVASIDSSRTVDCDGNEYPCTVRHINCELLYVRQPQIKRCNTCQHYRATLRVCRARQSSMSDESKTCASSRTKYSSLTPMEKDKRLKNLQQSLQQTKQQMRQLEARAQQVVERDGIQLSQEDADDVSAVVKELSQSVEDSFPEHSSQRIFWDQQKQYHQLKDKRQMRWHPLVVRFALNLKYAKEPIIID